MALLAKPEVPEQFTGVNRFPYSAPAVNGAPKVLAVEFWGLVLGVGGSSPLLTQRARVQAFSRTAGDRLQP